MAITVRLKNGTVREVATSQGESSAKRKARIQEILDKYATQGENGVSEVLTNRFERTRLLKELREIGMDEWIKRGSKAQFERLVNQAASRPFDGYMTDYDQWAKKYGRLRKNKNTLYGHHFFKGTSAEEDEANAPLIVSPEVMDIGAPLAQRARKAYNKGRDYLIGGKVRRAELESQFLFLDVLEHQDKADNSVGDHETGLDHENPVEDGSGCA